MAGTGVDIGSNLTSTTATIIELLTNQMPLIYPINQSGPDCSKGG